MSDHNVLYLFQNVISLQSIVGKSYQLTWEGFMSDVNNLLKKQLSVPFKTSLNSFWFPYSNFILLTIALIHCKNWKL